MTRNQANALRKVEQFIVRNRYEDANILFNNYFSSASGAYNPDITPAITRLKVLISIVIKTKREAETLAEDITMNLED